MSSFQRPNFEALRRARAEGDNALNSPRLTDALARDVDAMDADRLLRHANAFLSSPRAEAHEGPGAAETPQRTDAPAEGITCPTCFGDGYVMCPPPHRATCPECNGTKIVPHLGDLDLARNPYRSHAAHNGIEGELLSEGVPPLAPIKTPVSKLSPETLKFWANPPMPRR